MRVYKYEVPLKDEFSLQLPPGAQVLDVQMQGDTAQLWALVDPTFATVVRRFILRGTGHDVSIYGHQQVSHCGTFQMDGGALVFHVFEVLS